jgi:excisionase family DNA binding protein
MATNAPPKMLRPKLVADELDVSTDVVYRAIRRGDLAAVRLGERGALRIPRTAVEAWLTPTRSKEKT